MKTEMLTAFREHNGFVTKMAEREQKRDGAVTDATLNELEVLKEVDGILSRVKV